MNHTYPEEQQKAAPAKSAKTKSAPVKPAATSKEADKQWAEMQENMKKMQAQMEKIHQTTDPKEREKLLQEHMRTMEDTMQVMRGMGGGMMMGMMDGGKTGGGMMGGGMMGGQGSPGATPDKNIMERRMDMMHMMMEQMMGHERALQETPK